MAQVGMPSEESRLIETLRVFCITAMMWVHVSPGLSTPSVVSTDDFRLVGLVLGHTLGRVSVSLLSFVSGYLLWQRARQKPFLVVARGRFRTIVVPMLVWSALFILLAAMKAPMTGTASHKIAGIDPDGESLANAWAGITGPTANLSLFFLRDLFVATLVLRAAFPLLERLPALCGVAALLLPAAGGLEPFIFRPSILQFLVFGALAARLGVPVSAMARPLTALPLGYLMTVAGLVAAASPGNPVLEALNLPIFLLRAGVCLLALAFVATLRGMIPRAGVERIGRHAYLAYLMHMPVLGLFWTLWHRLVGTEQDPGYLAFYLAAPFSILALAVMVGRTLDHAPEVLQLALRGRIVRRGGPKGAD